MALEMPVTLVQLYFTFLKIQIISCFSPWLSLAGIAVQKELDLT